MPLTLLTYFCFAFLQTIILSGAEYLLSVVTLVITSRHVKLVITVRKDKLYMRMVLVYLEILDASANTVIHFMIWELLILLIVQS
jgi:hypothetical protein